MQDVVLLSTVGIRVVLVHGGGPEISAMLKKIGKESRFVGGLRYTDRETMEVVEMVLAGKVNKTLVQQLEAHGGRAIGLCGLDGGMIKAVRHQGEDLGFVGDVTHVNVTLIRTSLDSDTIPVVATIARRGGRRDLQYQRRHRRRSDRRRPRGGEAGADDRCAGPAAGQGR